MPAQEGTAKSAAFIVISQAPDICKSPGTPIPYQSFAFLKDATLISPNTNFQSFPVFHMGSRVTTVYGHEPGIGGGVVSKAYKGFCRPIVPVTTVFCNGRMLCRHEHTLFLMNCQGPEGPPNTYGKVYYLGAMLACDVGPNGALPGGSNAVLDAGSPAEASYLDRLKDSLRIDSIEDAVGLAQRAYDLTQVDWSSPSAALGALAGMAGRAGFGDLATAIKMGQTAISTDWKDPASALRAAAGMAGNAWKLGQSLGMVPDPRSGSVSDSENAADPRDPATEANDAAEAPPELALASFVPRDSANSSNEPTNSATPGERGAELAGSNLPSESAAATSPIVADPHPTEALSATADRSDCAVVHPWESGSPELPLAEKLAERRGCDLVPYGPNMDLSPYDRVITNAHGRPGSIEMGEQKFDGATYGATLRNSGFQGSRVDMVSCQSSTPANQGSSFTDAMAGGFDDRVQVCGYPHDTTIASKDGNVYRVRHLPTGYSPNPDKPAHTIPISIGQAISLEAQPDCTPGTSHNPQ